MILLRYFLRRPYQIILAGSVLTAIMLPGVISLRFNNSPDNFLPRNTESIRRHEEFIGEFGNQQSVNLVLVGEVLWTRRGLKWTGQLEKDLLGLRGVRSVLGPGKLSRLLSFFWPPNDPETFKGKIRGKKSPLPEGIIYPDKDLIIIQVNFSDIFEPAGTDIIDGIKILTADPPEGIHVVLSGLPVLQRMIDQSLTRMIFRVYPLLMIMGLLFLVLVFRNWKYIWIPLFFVVAVQIILFGVMGYSGGTINLINIILSPIVFVVSLATVIQIFIRYRHVRSSGLGGFDGLVATYRHKSKPVMWTGVTTMLAFGSLITGDLPLLQSMGFWSAFGIGIMMLLAFSLLPSLMMTLPVKAPPRSDRWFEQITRGAGRKISRWVSAHHLMVWVGLGATFLLMISGMGKIKLQENLNKYFSRRHPGYSDLAWLEKHQVGMVSAELVIKNPYGAGFRNPAMLSKLSRLGDDLEENPLFKNVMSAGDLLDAAVAGILIEGEVTESVRWLALGALQSMDETKQLLRSMLSENGQCTRLTILMPVIDFKEFNPHLHNTVSKTKRMFPGTDVWITGYFPMILFAQQSLSRSLILALSVTFLMVVLVLYLLMRNFRLTMLVMIPNIWPIVLIFGGMGLFGIPIDSAAILTSAIVLGVAVDDTIHTLVYFFRIRKRYGSVISTIKTIEQLSPAHILTSVILVLGFLLCTLSDLLPVSRMAGISALGIGLALIGDMVIIPSILGKIPPGYHIKK